MSAVLCRAGVLRYEMVWRGAAVSKLLSKADCAIRFSDVVFMCCRDTTCSVACDARLD